MSSVLHQLILVTVFVFCGQCVSASRVYIDTSLSDCCETTCKETKVSLNRDVLHNDIKNNAERIEPVHEQSAAVLVDTFCTNLFSNSRPQRILPLFGQTPCKLLGKIYHNLYYKNKVKMFSGRFPLSVTHPFLLVAPCDCYVIALRHIIR